MREADIDGFRLDAVKHLGERPVARFCSAIREYAYRLGKRWFFLFGELVAGDDTILGYIGPNTPVSNSDRNIYYGLTSVLDFPLYWTLPNVVKGFTSPQALVQRYEASLGRSLSRGELSRYLVTFLDNHDQIGQEPKRRFGTQTPPQQIVAGIGLLLTLLGTPCIYYGTEQGFSGIGSDHDIREAMFDPGDPSNNFLNQNCDIYKGIATIAKIFKEVEALRFGRIYFREISDNGRDFGLPLGHPCTLAFSRILTSEEVLIAYNTSAQNARNDYIVVDSKYQAKRTKMKFLYGGTGDVNIHSHPDPNNSTRFVQLNLLPNQLAILM
jgi:alpha-amylase